MDSIRKPDLNAPRFRKKIVNSLNDEFCDNVRRDIFECRSFLNSDIKNIINTFNEIVCETVIEVRDGVDLPAQLGHIFIGTCPPGKKRKNLDMRTSVEYMQKIQHRNWESDQHVAKIFFTTFGNKYRFKNHDLWAFDSTRVFARNVSSTYPQYWKRYIEVDPKIKISNLYKTRTYYIDKAEQEKSLLEEYNEFDL